MTSDDRSSVFDLVDRLPITPLERDSFFRTDAESILANVRLLTAAAYYFNAHGVTEYGGRLGAVRDRGLVEQVVAAAFQGFGGFDPHPTHWTKAGMLFRGITQGHPFNDGNKRTGFLLAGYYLTIVGYDRPPQFSVDEVVDFCLRVSAGDVRDIEAIAMGIKRLWGA